MAIATQARQGRGGFDKEDLFDPKEEGLIGSITETLRAYATLVRTWAPRLDLVAPGDLDRLEERHIDDSLRLLPLLDNLLPGPCIDVGSGAGLPGIPLAIASDRHWRLLEPRGRRTAFLEEVVRELDLDCEVVSLTAEAAAKNDRFAAAHAFATARALAPPASAFKLLLPLVAAHGTAAVYVGAGAEIPSGAEEWKPGIATMTVDPHDLEGTS